MYRRHLHSDPGLSFGHYREVKSNDIDSFLEEFPSHFLRQHSVVQHDGYYGMLPWLDVKTGSGHLFSKIVGIGFQLISQFGGL